MTLPRSLRVVTVEADAEVAALIHAVLRDALRRIQRNDGVVFPESVWDFVAGCQAAAELRRAQRSGVAADVALATPETLRPASLAVHEELTVTEAADLLGVKPQAIRARLKRGTIPGRHNERGHWRIRRTNLQSEELTA